MSISEYNGGAVLAMKGDRCVVVASDKRLGAQALTVNMEFPKVFEVADRLYVGMAGLVSDILTLQVEMYKLNEERSIRPKAFAHLVSSCLYEKRFGPYYVEPIIAGLDPVNNYEPFITSMDCIGCLNWAEDFVVAGTPSPNLYGMCESLWEPNMGPEELFEKASQALVNAVDRDALSGWGAVYPGKGDYQNLEDQTRLRVKKKNKFVISDLYSMSSAAIKKRNEKYAKNVTKRGSVKTTSRVPSKYPVGPMILGFLLFVVIGSALFQIFNNKLPF